MLQAIMTAPGQIEFRDQPLPGIGAGQVLVKVHRIGVCGSDMHVYHGKHPYTSYPVVQGHEVSGEIAETGKAVSGLSRGDRVTIQPQVVCGTCHPCRNGRYHICDSLKVMGFQTMGAASEYFAVDAARVLKVGQETSFDHGAMVEPLAVGVHALRRAGDVRGKTVLILGAGPIGNLAAQAARGMGARTVAITDLSDFRLGIAASCGIERRLDASTGELGPFIMEAFGPDRPDLMLECIGANTTIDQAIAQARKGSDIIVVGVFEERPKIDLGLVQDRELRLIGTLMYQETDFITAIELIQKGLVSLSPLVTDHFPFHAYLDAYHHIESHPDRTMKVMIDVVES
ncbi:MAG: alcohol dehydrogenase catalytic domain-containing protein [Spirochaetota bacterium]